MHYHILAMFKFKLLYLLLGCWLLSPQVVYANQNLTILPPGNPVGWDKKVFNGITDYSVATIDDRPALRASSHGTASGLVKEIKVDLAQTPYLHWSWRVDNILQGNNERAKSGDDYPARIYIVVSGGMFFWKTRAMNYVWASGQPAGAAWPNAYTGQAHMLAVRSGAQGLAQWQDESRNVAADLKQYFGEDIRYIDAVAIMTDTDDTKQQASAYYGEIYFSSQP